MIRKPSLRELGFFLCLIFLRNIILANFAIMKFKYLFFVLFCSFYSFAQLPKGFVYVKDIIPDLNVELRYNTTYNFVGKQVDGYKSNRLILTKQAAEALRLVQADLEDRNLCLKIYDGYRPQQGVNHFIRRIIT